MFLPIYSFCGPVRNFACVIEIFFIYGKERKVTQYTLEYSKLLQITTKTMSWGAEIMT